MNNAAELGRELYELGLRLGGLGTVAVGSGGGALARMLARLIGCGAALAGGEVKFYDGTCAACGAWLGRHYGLPMSVFIRQEEERVEVYLLDGQAGRTAPVGAIRVEDAGVEEWDLLTGTDCAWAANRAGGRLGQGVVSAQGPAALTLALERLGYEVADRPIPGAVQFEADREGLTLTVKQGGRTLRPIGEDALEAAVSYADQPQAVPAFHPADDGTQQK